MRHVVVVIPGIGGSVLGPGEGGRSSWDASVTGIGRVLTDPTRLSLEEHPELRPDGLIGGVTVLGGMTVLPGYRDLVRGLINGLGAVDAVLRPDELPDPRVDLLLFPYDFRLGIAAAAERLATSLHPLVGSADARWPGRPVLVVAHSMGGLVARYWAGALGGWRHCAGMVTLGTPHRGAPKALEWLVNGIRLGRTWHRATEVVRAWPGAWDLIPRYEAVYDADGGRSLRAEDLPEESVNASGSLAASAARVPAGLRAGARTHADIAAGWGDIPSGRAPAIHAVFSRGHDTPAEAILSAGRLTVRKKDAAWLPSGGWDGGDGTVPALSAVPVELSQAVGVRVPVWQRHGPLGSSPEAARIVKEYETESIAAVRGDSDPGIVLDLDDFPPPRAPVKAFLRNAEAGSQTRLTLRARRVGVPAGQVRRWLDAPMSTVDGVGWRADLPVEETGTWEVRVEATGVPLVAPPPAADVVEVVGGGSEDGEVG